jgi:hypothetical protein
MKSAIPTASHMHILRNEGAIDAQITAVQLIPAANSVELRLRTQGIAISNEERLILACEEP